MTELSPAAQAVDTALAACIQLQGEIIRARPLAAAALEAVADEVVPYLDEPDWGACDEMKCDIELYTDHMRKRDQLLAIAAELRGTTPTETP